MKRLLPLSLFTAAILVPLSSSLAAEAGDRIIRVGLHNIDPKSSNSEIVNVEDDTQVTFDFTYLFTDNWAIEVLAALPFEHDIVLLDRTVVGSTKHLPPTVSVQYRFGSSKVQPFIGAGLNYTVFSGEKLRGPLAGADLSLDSSTGLALQIGLDVQINERLLFNATLRSIDIETDASVNGVALTKVAIDPTALGLSIGWTF
jgi:outer membrane protein